VPVEGGPGDADGGADVVDADAVEAVSGEQLGGGGQDLLPPARRGGLLGERHDTDGSRVG